MLALYVVRMENHQDADDPINEYYVKFIGGVKNLENKFTKIDAGIKYPGHPGYLFNSKAAQSERFNIKPSDLISPDIDINSPEAELQPDSISQLIADSPSDAHIPQDLKDQMVDYLKNSNTGDMIFNIKNGFKHRSAHEKYLGEWAAPIAVIKGQVVNPDELLKAEYHLMHPGLFSECNIVYPTNPTQKLVDSYVVHPKTGKRVGISSKTKSSGGAAASVTGLWEILQKKADDPNVATTMNNFSEAIDIIRMIVESNMREGPLVLGKYLEVINEDDAKVVLGMIEEISLGNGNNNSYNDLTKTLQRIVNEKGANQDNDKYNIGFHVLTAVAFEVADRIKNSHSIKFTDAVKAILNHDDFIQVYASSKKDGEDLEFGHFKVTYPPSFEGQVELNVSKNYMATGIKGKMGFKFK